MQIVVLAAIYCLIFVGGYLLGSRDQLVLESTYTASVELQETAVPPAEIDVSRDDSSPSAVEYENSAETEAAKLAAPAEQAGPIADADTAFPNAAAPSVSIKLHVAPYSGWSRSSAVPRSAERLHIVTESELALLLGRLLDENESQWGYNYEENILKTISEYDESATITVDELDCRKSYCKLIISFETYSAWQRVLAEMTGQAWWETVVYATDQPMSGPRTFVFSRQDVQSDLIPGNGSDESGLVFIEPDDANE